MDVLNESGNEVKDITFKKIMPFGGMVQVLKYHVIAIIVFQSRGSSRKPQKFPVTQWVLKKRSQ